LGGAYHTSAVAAACAVDLNACRVWNEYRMGNTHTYKSIRTGVMCLFPIKTGCMHKSNHIDIFYFQKKIFFICFTKTIKTPHPTEASKASLRARDPLSRSSSF
jgi:hypothetical protein